MVWLLNESATGPPTHGLGRVNCAAAAAGPDAGPSPFRSWLPIYPSVVPAILAALYITSGTSAVCFCADNVAAEVLWCAQTEACEPAAVANQGLRAHRYL